MTTTNTTKRKKIPPPPPPIPHVKLTLLLGLTLLSLLLTPRPVHGAIEEVEVTPSSTNGIELGELSFPQFIFACVVFINIVALYAVGVLPVEIDLGDKFPIFGGGVGGVDAPAFGDENGDEYEGEVEYMDYAEYYDGGDGGGDEDVAELTRRRLQVVGGGVSRPRGLVSVPNIALDCTLQYVCDVDRWTAMKHTSIPEKLLAYMMRNKDSVWKRDSRAVFGGLGTCREMYPCPFDVQSVVGIKIPGSEPFNKTITY